MTENRPFLVLEVLTVPYLTFPKSKHGIEALYTGCHRIMALLQIAPDSTVTGDTAVLTWPAR